MGVLCDVIVAKRDEAAAIHLAKGRHLEKWVGADVKGLDTIKLGSLWGILSGDVVDYAYMADAIGSSSPDGPWVFLVSAELVGKLVALDEESVESVAEKWAATEECVNDRWRAANAEEYLNTLCEFSRKAEEKGSELLLWMSL